MKTNALQCDVCGRFIPWKDFDTGAATRHMSTPDSDYSVESYKTRCRLHSEQKR